MPDNADRALARSIVERLLGKDGDGADVLMCGAFTATLRDEFDEETGEFRIHVDVSLWTDQ